MTTDERLRLDYDRTTDLLRTLTDVRFKLLALVPTISGAAVGLLGRAASAAELLAVGAIGLVATVGIALYELQNSAVFAYAARRAHELEARLELVSLASDRGGGLYAERPRGAGGSLALVYGAALAGWTYLVVWGALRALDVGAAQKVGGAVGFVAGVVVVAALGRADRA